jgi:hypothetical protein
VLAVSIAEYEGRRWPIGPPDPGTDSFVGAGATWAGSW